VQNVLQSDAPQEFGAHPIGDSIDNLLTAIASMPAFAAK